MNYTKLLRLSLILLASAGSTHAAGQIINHRNTVLNSIPLAAIAKAKDSLHVVYGHTSHGSQLLSGNGSGTSGLNKVRGVTDVFVTSPDGAAGTLHLLAGTGYEEGGMVGDAGWDHPSVANRLRFVSETRSFLGTPNTLGRGSKNPKYNVVMWSWCGQVSYHGDSTWHHYLVGMDSLEREYPGVAFVYMTGHLDGSGSAGQLNLRNEEMRAFARTRGKWLFDFADIESYDPDGREYLSLGANDNGDYDANGDGTLDSNWAIAWTAKHTTAVNTDIGAAHSQPLVGQLKTTAAWWMFAALAGWAGPTSPVSPVKAARAPASIFPSTQHDLLGRANRKLLFFGR